MNAADCGSETFDGMVKVFEPKGKTKTYQ